MKPVLIYGISCMTGLVFEWAFRTYSRRCKTQASRAQWSCFIWTSGLLLCGICLMRPFNGDTFIEWSPMFLVAFFHIQQAQQADMLDRYTSGRNGSASTGSKP